MKTKTKHSIEETLEYVYREDRMKIIDLWRTDSKEVSVRRASDGATIVVRELRPKVNRFKIHRQFIWKN